MSQAGSYSSRRRGLAEFISTGRHASVLEELATRLGMEGYCPSTIQGYVRAARHVTYSIEHRQLARRDLTLAGLRRFARTHASPMSDALFLTEARGTRLQYQDVSIAFRMLRGHEQAGAGAGAGH